MHNKLASPTVYEPRPPPPPHSTLRSFNVKDLFARQGDQLMYVKL